MKILLIPSAKLIDPELRVQFGHVPSVMVPLKGKPIVDYLYHQYVNSVDKIIILAHEEYEKIQDYVEFKSLKVTVLKLNKVYDLGFSIYQGLEYIENEFASKVNKIIINLGDTIVESRDYLKYPNGMLYANTTDARRWTTFKFNDGNINSIQDKCENAYEDTYNSFIGVYWFSNFKLLHKLLATIISNKDESISMDSFYATILEYNMQYKYQIISGNKWLDIGHSDQYFNSKKHVEARYFNSIEIDQKRGIITKKSSNKNKFIKEILWYLKLPLELQYIAPRVFDYSVDYINPYIKMEYYGYSTLSELFVYGKLDLSVWKIIFNNLFEVIRDMMNFKYTLKNTSVETCLNEMYIDKTIRRLQKIKDLSEFHLLFTNNIIINEVEYQSINYYISNITSLVKKYDLFNIEYFNIIHGDLCLPNILFDIQKNIIRCIDPRGSFGKYDLYGDVRYDLAKLSHSMNGKYDFIIYDLFEIEIKGNEIRYKLYCHKEHDQIRDLYYKYLAKFNYDLDQIQLIEGLLFFSMVPLHKDNIKRQYMMLVTAIQIFDSLIKKGGLQ